MLDKKLSNEEKLDMIYEMTKENHDMLLSIRRQNYVSTALRIIYWIVILGAIGGVYYYLSPAISILTENASKVRELLEQLNTMTNQMPETQLINSLIEGLKKSTTGGQ